MMEAGMYLFAVMMTLAVGLDLEASEFRGLVKKKQLIGGVLAVQAILLPLVAVCLARALGLSADLSTCMLLLAASPVGDTANFYTVLARANAALTVTVSTISGLFPFATVPAVFMTFGPLLGKRFSVEVPVFDTAVKLLMLGVLPVLAGLYFKHLRPGLALKVGTWLRGGCLACLISCIVVVALTQRQSLAGVDWKGMAAASAAMMVISMFLGFALGRALRLGERETIAFSFIFPVRNVGLASVVAITIMNRVDYAVLGLVYLITQIPLMLGAVALGRLMMLRGQPEWERS